MKIDYFLSTISIGLPRPTVHPRTFERMNHHDVGCERRFPTIVRHSHESIDWFKGVRSNGCGNTFGSTLTPCIYSMQVSRNLCLTPALFVLYPRHPDPTPHPKFAAMEPHTQDLNEDTVNTSQSGVSSTSSLPTSHLMLTAHRPILLSWLQHFSLSAFDQARA